MKVFRPGRKNAAKAEAREASDRQGPVGQVCQQEQGDRHRHRLFKLRRSRNVVASQRDDPVRSKVHGKVSPHKIRRRVRINRYSSARRHLWEQLSTANLAEPHNQDSVSKSRLRPVEDRRMKRAPNDKECRVLVGSRLRHNRTSSRSCSGSKVARLPQPITARVMGSREVGKENNRDKHHRQGSNNILWRNNISGCFCLEGKSWGVSVKRQR